MTLQFSLLLTPILPLDCHTFPIILYDFAVGFEPNATMDVAHHMLLYGCREPGQKEEVYNCNEMASSNEPGYKSANPCAQGSQIIYAWARDAPKLDLPKGVAFKVGGNTGIQYLVLQVHYADVSTFVEGNQISFTFLFPFSQKCLTLANFRWKYGCFWRFADLHRNTVSPVFKESLSKH